MVTAGDLLCFLHADTQPPHEVVNVIRGVMAQPNTVLGGFRTVIQTDGKRLHGMTFHHLVKTHYVAMLLRPLAFARSVIAQMSTSQQYMCLHCSLPCSLHVEFNDATLLCMSTTMWSFVCVVMQTMPEPVFLVNVSANVQWCNHPSGQLHGRST